jgi:hypothetical protein
MEAIINLWTLMLVMEGAHKLDIRRWPSIKETAIKEASLKVIIIVF